MKKLTVMLLVMTLVFGLAACGNASEKGSNVTETQAQSAEDTGAGNAELNKLYEKENAIIAKHQELWNTVFNNIDKDKAADAGEQNYGTFLETQLDHVKDQFSEADLKKLDKDIEEIKKIEDQVTELTAQMGTENSGAQSANAETSQGNLPGICQERDYPQHFSPDTGLTPDAPLQSHFQVHPSDRKNSLLFRQGI